MLSLSQLMAVLVVLALGVIRNSMAKNICTRVFVRTHVLSPPDN